MNFDHTITRLVGAICPYCDSGWNLSNVGDSHDDPVLGMVHLSCVRRHHGILDRRLYSKVCINAGLRHSEWVKHVNNGSYGGPHNSIWEVLPSGAYPMTLSFSRRKRVWVLTVDGQYTSSYERPDWPLDFLETKSTRDHAGTSVTVHAWTEEELQGYLHEIVKHIKERWPEEQGE